MSSTKLKFNQAICFAFCICSSWFARYQKILIEWMGQECQSLRRGGLESEFSCRHTQRLPAVLEFLSSLQFILSASSADLSLTVMVSRNLPPTYTPGRAALALCLSGGSIWELCLLVYWITLMQSKLCLPFPPTYAQNRTGPV